MSISPSSANCVAIAPPPKRRAEAEQIEIVGSSAAMRRLRLQVRRIGPYFRSVMVSGEAGSGKELVARALHAMGPVGELVVCGTAEVEGVLARHEMSLRGTLFLNEVSEMRLEAQDQLLRVLKKHERAQSSQESSQRSDLRMIAATREDLRTLASAGRFRQELYQRFATLEIAVPPLRERIEDLPELASFFLRRFTMLYVPEIADDAVNRMRQYRWPGNVRELEHVLRDAVMRSNGGRVELHHLPKFNEKDTPSAAVNKGARLQDVVEQHVLHVLKDCGGNKLRAAETLGISRSTLYRMLEAGASSIDLR